MRLIVSILAVVIAGPAFAQGAGSPQHFMEQWDANADGAVTPAEAQAKRGEVFYMFDQNEDKVLDSAEWALVAEHMAAEMDAKAEGGQRQGQGQGSGHGQGKGPGAVMHQAMTPGFNDADGDGVVTEAEFLAATDRLFAGLDRNGDGQASAADFAR